MENEKNELFTVVDDEGNEYVIADLIEVDDKKYAILVAAEGGCECEDECDCEEEAFILRVEEGADGEDELVDIEDDEEYERVLEALDELEEYEDEDEDEDED